MTTSPTGQPAASGSDLRQPAYDAVYAVIRSLPRERLGQVERDAAIWRSVHAALDATGVPALQTSGERRDAELEQLRGELTQSRAERSST